MALSLEQDTLLNITVTFVVRRLALLQERCHEYEEAISLLPTELKVRLQRYTHIN